MPKKAYLFIIILTLAGVTGGVLYSKYKPAEPVACTQEAKLCPDGSAVGRVGPNCGFAACPDTSTSGTITGKVIVGPICPVEREGVPCPVPPEAYTSREIILYSADGVTEVQRMHFAADGTYAFTVPAGEYVLDIPHQGIGGTSDLPKKVNVTSGTTIVVNFSIDTGIR